MFKFENVEDLKIRKKQHFLIDYMKNDINL